MRLFTKAELQKQLEAMGILPTDTLLVHSSMKAIGEVEGGADTVLDALMDYMHKGLLILPTHTWQQINAEYNVFDVLHEPSCVGILTNIFRQRPGVIRSWHPTHSVAAYGKDAADYTRGEEQFDTPCPRAGCYGKLYDRKAKILFLGCRLNRNTTIHGVEEWNKIPNRLATVPQLLWIKTPQGDMIRRPMYGHFSPVTHFFELHQTPSSLLARELLAGGLWQGGMHHCGCSSHGRINNYLPAENPTYS